VAYTLSKKAEDDLVEIYINGVTRFGVERADHYHESFELMFGLLAANPRMARARLEISPPVRIHPFHSHLIVYTMDNNDDIFIVRIRHGHEDWQNNP